MRARGAIYVRARRHGVRYHLFVTIDGHRLAEVRKTWTRRAAIEAATRWKRELELATDDELLNMPKVSS